MHAKIDGHRSHIVYIGHVPQSCVCAVVHVYIQMCDSMFICMPISCNVHVVPPTVTVVTSDLVIRTVSTALLPIHYTCFVYMVLALCCMGELNWRCVVCLVHTHTTPLSPNSHACVDVTESHSIHPFGTILLLIYYSIIYS